VKEEKIGVSHERERGGVRNRGFRIDFEKIKLGFTTVETIIFIEME